MPPKGNINWFRHFVFVCFVFLHVFVISYLCIWSINITITITNIGLYKQAELHSVANLPPQLNKHVGSFAYLSHFGEIDKYFGRRMIYENAIVLCHQIR